MLLKWEESISFNLLTFLNQITLKVWFSIIQPVVILYTNILKVIWKCNYNPKNSFHVSKVSIVLELRIKLFNNNFYLSVTYLQCPGTKSQRDVIKDSTFLQIKVESNHNKLQCHYYISLCSEQEVRTLICHFSVSFFTEIDWVQMSISGEIHRNTLGTNLSQAPTIMRTKQLRTTTHASKKLHRQSGYL